jgi:hypothetical protein
VFARRQRWVNGKNAPDLSRETPVARTPESQKKFNKFLTSAPVLIQVTKLKRKLNIENLL